jgi:subtilase family serine protease
MIYPVMKPGSLFAMAVSVSVALSSQFASAGQVLTGLVPEAAARLQLQPVGSLPGTNRLRLAIGFPLRNREDLSDLLEQIYNPASTNYHHYLSPQQFTDRFGPTAHDYREAIDYINANKLTIVRTYDNRMLLDVSGTVSDIEIAFHISLNIYQHPTENRTFYAPNIDPSLDSNVPLLQIDGLDNYAMPSPESQRNVDTQNPTKDNSGSGPDGTFTGKDFRNAYVPKVSLDGAGQSVGLVEFAGYYASDIASYEDRAGLPHVPLVNVSVDGYVAAPGSGGETPGDIEMVVSIATNLQSVVVFEASSEDSTAIWNDMLNLMASSNQIKQFSCSWRLPTLTSSNQMGDQILQEMGVQGQSFFKASGDGDAYVYPIQWPNDSPWVTAVGGTELTMNGSGASYNSETVWNSGEEATAWGGNGDSGYWGSGGGVSTTYGLPNYQIGVSTELNSASATMRNIPDVAMVADHIGIVYDDGESGSFYGTSFAAPLWAGFMALVNQEAAKDGLLSVGFANPAIYSIGRGTNYAACFHDITTGSNTWSQSQSNYFATVGYDLCTGWGSPNGSNLINGLISEVSLSVRPSITSAPISNDTLALIVSGGSAGASFTFLTSTNLAAPLSDWKTNSTGVFTDSGTYSNIIQVNQAVPDRFFLIRIP